MMARTSDGTLLELVAGTHGGASLRVWNDHGQPTRWLELDRDLAWDVMAELSCGLQDADREANR